MTGTWVPLASAGIAALVGAFANSRWNLRNTRRSASEAASGQAAAELHEALLSLHRLVREARADWPEPSVVTERVTAVTKAVERHKSRLPSSLTHLDHSVWDSMGTLFGGPGASGRVPEVTYEPMHAFDYRWWDAGLTYLRYALAAVAFWPDHPHASARIKCLACGDWLRETERVPDVV